MVCVKKKRQSEISYERLSRVVNKENAISEGLEAMLINDVKRLLNSYLVYQNDDLRFLFRENLGDREITITVKYRNFKDVKIL